MALKDRLKQNKNTISKNVIESDQPDAEEGVVVPFPQETAVAKNTGAYEDIVREIRELQADLGSVEEAITERKKERAKIITGLVERILHVRKNPKFLPIDEATGDRISFTTFLKSLGMERQYVYEQITAYNLCEQHGRLDLFGRIDYKVFVLLSRAPGATKAKTKKWIKAAGDEEWTRGKAQRFLQRLALSTAELDPLAAEFLKKIEGVKGRDRQQLLRKQIQQILEATAIEDKSKK